METTFFFTVPTLTNTFVMPRLPMNNAGIGCQVSQFVCDGTLLVCGKMKSLKRFSRADKIRLRKAEADGFRGLALVRMVSYCNDCGAGPGDPCVRVVSSGKAEAIASFHDARRIYQHNLQNAARRIGLDDFIFRRQYPKWRELQFVQTQKDGNVCQ